MRPEQLLQALKTNSRMLILCNPSNPSGHLYSPEHLRKFAEILRGFPQVFVLSDEIYEKIIYEGEHISFASIEGMWNRTLIVNGFSKSFAMTGLRLGYLAAPKHIIEACTKVQSHNTSCPSSIVQYAGVVALEKTEKSYFENAVAGFREKRDYVLSELAKIGLRPPTPEGAFYIFLDVSSFLSSTVPTSQELCVYILKNYHLAVVPGEGFGLPEHIRLSYATSIPQLKEAIKRLVAGLTSLKKIKSAL